MRTAGGLRPAARAARPGPSLPLPTRGGHRHRFLARARVIAAPSERGSGPAPQQQQQQSPPSSWAGLVSWLPVWGGSNAGVSTSESRRVQEALDHMHSSPDGAPPDIRRFLRPLSAHDLKQMRALASLCGMTYYMGSRVTPRRLARLHGMDLVSTSLACERLTYVHEASAREVALDGDGACLSLPEAHEIYADRGAPAAEGGGEGAAQPAPPAAAGAAVVANVVPFSRALAGSSAATEQQQRRAAAAAAADAQQVQQQREAAAAVAAEASELAARLASSGKASTSAPAAQAGSGSTAAADSSSSSSSPSGPSSSAGSAGAGSSSVSPSSKQAGGGGGWNPADRVTAKLSEAAAAASAAALAPLASAASAASAAALGPLASAAGSLYAGGLGLVSSRLGMFPAAAAAPLTERLAGATIAGIAGMEVASSHPNGSDVKAASTSTAACPSEWFVADDGVTHTRLFVIQGSDSLDHWRTNLAFEPVVFEDPSLGIRVHRGAYEAACALYDRFLPLVQEQAHSHALARVAFTGHSIGGSMATLLALMFVSRGVLRPDQVAPTITFGSPAIFCAAARGGCSACGGCGCSGCPGAAAAAAAQAAAAAASPAAATAGLLQRLGLGEGAVRNVLMTRDIVPRAFACDYSLVADILRSWGPHWRDHNCLNWENRKQMFVHLGRSIVMQPSPELRFAAEPGLPLLPAGGGAYELAPPTLAARMRAAAARAAAARDGKPAGREAACVGEALAALMDNPHPLETLADPGAYLDSGTISRYHNPDNYCRALGRLLADRREADGEALTRPSRVPGLAAAGPPRVAAGAVRPPAPRAEAAPAPAAAAREPAASGKTSAR
ncbi:triacylglycerol lipase [Raphidocelis subcapitata]|uniref:Triacylglycerol lipase n=1 Tax=Raphidocelis subcapitata TaxID=307507 RepID=A0A2V0PJ82_9CHLO|nr:triacylglycerol lipase [Raphidocelis subcapitata]|eukprot:GBF97105.1 triacylglycerol lipase [Raphidocelis subcapitata]